MGHRYKGPVGLNMEEEQEMKGTGGDWAESASTTPSEPSPLPAATFGAPGQQRPQTEQPMAPMQHPTEQAMPPAMPYTEAATAPAAPQSVDQSYSQPAYAAPPPAYAAAPVEPTQIALGKIFARTLWLIVLLGALLMLLGTILAQVAETQGVLDTGFILGALGSFIVGAPMIITGVYYESFSDNVRFGLIVAGAIILGMNLI